MIKSLAKAAVLKTQNDWNQMQKNAWRKERETALSYYKGRTQKTTQTFFTQNETTC